MSTNERAGHELLCGALAADCCYVLGAGASSPHVPTMAQLPHRIAAYAPLLGSFAASTPRSPLHLLIEPLIERAQTTTSLNEWKVGDKRSEEHTSELQSLAYLV